MPVERNTFWRNCIIYFFLNCFCWTRGPLLYLFSYAALRGHPTVEYHPRWQPVQGLAVHCRLGRLTDSNLRLQVYSLVSLPLSHHCCPNEPPLLPQWATTAPWWNMPVERNIFWRNCIIKFSWPQSSEKIKWILPSKFIRCFKNLKDTGTYWRMVNSLLQRTYSRNTISMNL